MIKNFIETLKTKSLDLAINIFLKIMDELEPFLDPNGPKTEPKSTFRPCNCSCHGKITNGDHIQPCCYPELDDDGHG